MKLINVYVNAINCKDPHHRSPDVNCTLFTSVTVDCSDQASAYASSESGIYTDLRDCALQSCTVSLLSDRERVTMPSGLRTDTDMWLGSYEDATSLANEVLSSIQERNLKHPNGGPEASRISAAARRKLATLGTSLDNLADLLESPECSSVSEHEKNRRRDLITALRNRREQMQLSLKRDPNRAALLGQSGSSNGPARETTRTAELDNSGILQMQQDVMEDQDQHLAAMEQSVASTRHLALTINEELHVQERLLENFEEEVDVSHNKMRAAQKRIKGVLKGSSGDWRSILLAAALICLLIFVVLIAWKVIL